MRLIKTYSIAVVVTLISVFALRPMTPEAISPIAQFDTESPRSTLMGFINTINRRYAIGLGEHGVFQSYINSDRLYPIEEEERGLREIFVTRVISAKFMDLSDVADAAKMETMWRLSAQLKEVLDRLPLPDPSTIPDAEEMERTHKTRWQLPGTEIVISRVDTGPRSGSYLFNAETVANIPKYYAAIKEMPYLQLTSPNFYHFTFHAPSGVALFFRHVIPIRWFITLPSWTQILIADQPFWRWIGIVIALLSFFGMAQGARLVARKMAAMDDEQEPLWSLLPFIALVILSPAYSYFFAEVLRVSGMIFTSFNVFFWGTFFVALTWLVWKGGQILAEDIIISNEIRAVSIDSQIIRLTFRLLSLILSLALMTEGANRLGMPAYSILTGLGIGGLAVALAAQQTLANLLGSLIIMFEKPFRVGHWIKAGAIEGVVEDVGFRSTRIRTLQNSVISVPSSDLVNQSIENMTTRKFRLARRQIYISLKTPIGKVETLMHAIRSIIGEGGHGDRHQLEVTLRSITHKGYEVMFDFRVKAHNEAEEFKEQQRILLAIAHKAEQEGILFSRDVDLIGLTDGSSPGSDKGESSKGEGKSAPKTFAQD